MGHSQAEKAQSRERILAAAAAQIRRTGLESLSVAAVMQRAKLTHGGFYGHFGSRAELVAEALQRALQDGSTRARAVAAGDDFASYVRRYLSRAHRDAPETGCAIGALAAEAGRADPEVRAVMSESVEGYIAEVRAALGDTDDRRAMVAVSTLVGALTLARALADPARSDAVLRSARDRLLQKAVVEGRADW